jgi:predicted TIM-barrel fold metal-dependent hydrolase
MPEPNGDYYRSLAPVTPAGNMLALWTQGTFDLMAERWRTGPALKTYRSVGPIIYTEMSRRMITTDAYALLGEMVANKVTSSIVVAIDPYVPTDEILQAASRLQGVLLPFGSVDPAGDDYLERFAQLLEKPICGIKYHSDLQELPIGDPRMFAMMEVLAASSRSHLPVYLHTGNFPIYRPQVELWQDSLPKLAAAFPSITFVCGHSGWESPRSALKCSLHHSNIMLETSWQSWKLIRRLCDKLGPERLLFGSDFPLYSQTRALKNVRAALNNAEYEMVTHTNARRLLQLD